MMKKQAKTFLISTLLFSVVIVNAQETRFFMPKEIQKAYINGTRSYDGKPGQKYWHNTADYAIDVNVNPSEKLISGSEKVTYYNNSPKPMNSLVVRLYYDVYKRGNPRSSSLMEKDISDGVRLSNVKINEKEINVENNQSVRRSGTNIIFQLEKPIKAGKKLTFEVDWEQKIPFSNRRTGVYDSTSCFIAYFYPQIAVYDDIYGWDYMNYILQTEFYNGLANFDVNITMPKNYVVWATGTFQNPDKVLHPSILGKYRKAKESGETIEVVSADDLKKGFSVLDSTWHYKADEVSDFAFAFSDHYQWSAAKQVVDGRDVLVSSAFPTEKEKDFKNLTAVQQKSMKHLSEDVPGVPYPYEAFTTFIGLRGGGMEFPMMANNDGPGTGVTIHEMFHTYFPMYVRVNEKRWAWMDEGWASYTDALIEKKYFNNKVSFSALFAQNKTQIDGFLGSNMDVPLLVNSQNMDQQSYFVTSYPLSATIYTILHHHLGEEVFMKCYRGYINRWAKKSPTPYDFFYTFENISGEDLAWLWKPWFMEFGTADVAIQSIKKNKLIVENLGQKPVPLFVDIMYQDSTTKSISKSANIWSKGNKTVEINLPDYKKITQLSVNKQIPDADNMDNFYPSIEQRYKGAKLSENIFGDYKIRNFVGSIVKDANIAFFEIAQFNMRIPLYPVSDIKLSSLDDSKSFEFKIDQSGDCTGISVDWDGFVLTGEKL
jgi:hypothetical protein